MKVLLLVFVLISTAHGIDPASVRRLNEKYCELKVAEACATLDCLKDPKGCNMPDPSDKRKVQLEKQAAEIKKRCPKEDDFPCILKENKDVTKQVMEMDCIKGDQTACYFIEVSKSL